MEQLPIDNHMYFFTTSTEKPTSIGIQKIGDVAGNMTAKAGEEIDLVCTVMGGNPPPKISWYSRNQRISTSRQENSREKPGSRTWISISRLTLRVTKQDNGGSIRCEAEHPTLPRPLTASSALTVHCKY